MNLPRNSFRATLMAALGAALIAGFAAPTPAFALDDGDENIFDTVKGLLGAGVGFGLGQESEKPRIDYRERAPLVLPPANAALPAPVAPVGQRNAAWPTDYDVARAARARETARAANSAGNDPAMSARDIRNVGRVANNPARPAAGSECPDGDMGRICNPTEFWRVMKTTSAPDDSRRDLVAGQEPDRKRLTDPPKGFRAAKTTQKYSFEVREEVDLADPRAQIREEARRARQVD